MTIEDGDWELLSAYLDGEMSEEARAALETRMAAEPELRQRLAEATALETDLQTIGAHVLSGASIRAPSPPAVRPRRRAAASGWRAETRRRAFAMAATIAVAAGLGALMAERTFFGAGGSEDAPMRLAAGYVPTFSPIWRALETASTGAAVDVGDGRVAPLGTFFDATGRVCREIELIAGQDVEQIAFGVACRVNEGGWRVEFAATAPVREGLGEALAPAAGPGLDAFERLLDGLGAGPMLGPDAEAALLARGWAAPE